MAATLPQDGFSTVNGYASVLRPSAVGVANGGLPTRFPSNREGAAAISDIDRGPTPFLKSSERLLIAEHLLFHQRPIAVMPDFIFQRNRTASPAMGLMTGLVRAETRSVFHKVLSLALREGLPHAGFVTTQNGHYSVRRLASQIHDPPQICAGRKFFSGRCCCVFLTYANWFDGFRGLVAEFHSRTEPAGSRTGFRRKRGGRQ